MESIPAVSFGLAVPDEVLAQCVAAWAGWQWNLAGMIFDEEGVFVSRSLTTLGAVMRDLDWFLPVELKATGVEWTTVPDDRSTHADIVRAATPRP